MRASTAIFLAAASAVSAQTQDAPVVANNPVGAVFGAQLPNQEKYAVRGQFTATSANDGKGVQFQIAVSGLPAEGGPFLYHIHEKPVPADGNCTGTGAHLDPYKRGEDPPCDASQPQTCQTGDLSGKHGKIMGDAASFNYLDLYTSTNPSDPSYFGNLSVVVHLSNKTRIACANFSAIASGVSSSATMGSTGTALPTGTTNNTYSMPTATGSGGPSSSATGETAFTSSAPTQPSEPTESAPIATGAAGKVTMVGAGVLAGVFALFL